MSPFRPDLVDCWIYRVTLSARGVEQLEILLLRRAPGRILPGLWQCVSGSLEADERVALAALREVEEETAFTRDDILGFYDLDLVNQFHEPSVDAVMTSAVFAARVAADAEPTLSREHDDARWVPADDAFEDVVWPGYRTAIDRVRTDLADPERAAWFALTLDGRRTID